MSDDKQNLQRRLLATQRRIEEAYASYLDAAAKSHKSLTELLHSFNELTETISQLIDAPQPDAVAQYQETPQESKAAPPLSESAPQAAPPENNLPVPLNSHPPQVSTDDEPQPLITRPVEREIRAPRHRGLRIQTPGLVARQAPGEPAPVLTKDARIVLTNDGFGVAPILNELLAAQGYRVRVEGRRPELQSPTDVLIFLGSLRAPTNLDDAMGVVDDLMASVQKMSTRLMQPGSGLIAAIDTSGAFGLDDFDPVVAPFGAILGLIRLLKTRYPGAQSKLIDLGAPGLHAQQVAQLLADELLLGGSQSPIALRHAERFAVEWTDFDVPHRPAPWLEEARAPLIYLPGPDAILATAVERLAIAHELPIALLRRPGSPGRLLRHFTERGIETRSADYDLNRLFEVMDFFDRLRSDHGPIGALITESFPAPNRNDAARWDLARPALDEFNALLAITINDPLHLLGVGLSPHTPPMVASALRYFARAECLRRNEYLQVRLAHLDPRLPRGQSEFNPLDFALTELLSTARPTIAEIRIQPAPQH